MPGRKPKPTHLKLITGNPGKRPLNTREPQIPIELPPCPGDIRDEAKREWRRMGKRLLACGITYIDRAIFAGYCIAWARWLKAERELAKSGEVGKIPGSNTVITNPWWIISRRERELMLKFAAELGIGPSTRSRLVVYGQEHAHGDATDKFFA